MKEINLSKPEAGRSLGQGGKGEEVEDITEKQSCGQN